MGRPGVSRKGRELDVAKIILDARKQLAVAVVQFRRRVEFSGPKRTTVECLQALTYLITYFGARYLRSRRNPSFSTARNGILSTAIISRMSRSSRFDFSPFSVHALTTSGKVGCVVGCKEDWLWRAWRYLAGAIGRHFLRLREGAEEETAPCFLLLLRFLGFSANKLLHQ